MTDRDALFTALSALIDGDVVDPARVREALEIRGGIDALVDFAQIRWDLAHDRDGVERAPAQLRPVREPSRWRRALGVAAALVITLALGYGLGDIRARRALSAPPSPDRIVSFTLGTEWKASSR